MARHPLNRNGPFVPCQGVKVEARAICYRARVLTAKTKKHNDCVSRLAWHNPDRSGHTRPSNGKPDHTAIADLQFLCLLRRDQKRVVPC
jgi:hypothetical protein